MLESQIIKALEGINKGLFAPKEEISLNVLKNILNDVLEGNYQKENYFTDNLYVEVQDTDKETDKVLRINAVTELSSTVSVNLGGVIYKEPVFAVVAALNLSKNKQVIPVAKNYGFYKTLAQKSLLGLKNKSYKLDFFAKAVAFFNQDGSIEENNVPKFEIIDIPSENMIKLKSKGAATFLYDNELKLFELYLNQEF